jgi:F-type H+-transporting ATPase subunit epsilon
VLECEATFVALPAHDGEIGILYNRAPLLCRLGIGRLRVETASEKHVLFVAGGFAEMVANRLTILTEEAIYPELLVREEVEKSLTEALEMETFDEVSLLAQQRSVERARFQMKLLGE